MCAFLISSRFALRLLCGTLLVMALFDVPVSVGPDTAKWLGAMLLAGVLGSLAVLRSRREARKTHAAARHVAAGRGISWRQPRDK
jgi:hypothetical protein